MRMSLNDIEEKLGLLRITSVLFFSVFESMYIIFFSFYFFDGNQIFHPALLLFGIVPVLFNFLLCLKNQNLDNLVYFVVASYIFFRTFTVYYIKEPFLNQLILGFLIFEWLSYFVLLYIYLFLNVKLKSLKKATDYSPIL